MPHNWNLLKLGDIATLQRGFDLPSSKRVAGNVPIIAASGIGGFHNIAKVHGPGVITGRSGTIGKVMFEERDFWPLNTALWVKDFHGNDKKYIYYLLSNFDFSSFNNGTSVPTLNRNDVHAVDFSIPPLPEQHAIASILSALDDKIELNLQMNKTFEEMAMTLYKHWFVDFGPFQDGEFVESELGKIPKGWEVKNVKDFGVVITGKTPAKKFPEHFGDEMSFVTPTDFKNYGKHITGSNRGISVSGIQKHIRSILPINSVIVTCIGSDMGKVGLSKVECLTNQQINSLKTVQYHYMYYFFKSNYDLLKMLAGDGTTMPIINKTSFENLTVIYPTIEVLDKFNQTIIGWDNQMHSNTTENQTLTALRDTLLPKLISGEVRVKDIEQTLAAVL